MYSLNLGRLGYIIGALVLAVAMSWIGITYKDRSKLGSSSSPAGIQLSSISMLKIETAQQPSPEQMLARLDWVPMALDSSTGWSNKTLWAKLELQNTTALPRDVWLEVEPRRMAYVELHQKSKDGDWRVNVSGVAVPAKDRKIGLPDIVFLLQLQPLEKRVVLVQVDTQLNTAPINLAFALHEPSLFLGLATQSGLTDLLFIGATLALGSICLVIGAFMRQSLQILLGLRSLVLGVWLLMNLGFLSMLLPTALVAVMAQYSVWMVWVILVFTLSFVWLYLESVSARGMPKWGHVGFLVFAALTALSTAVTVAGLQQLTPWVLQLGRLFIVATAFTLLLSVHMVWRGQTGAALIILTSSVGLLINTQLHLSVLGVTNSDVLRQLISPVPVLVTTAVFFIGITAQLLRERQTRQALLTKGYQQTMALLEEKVAERTEALQQATGAAHQANAAKSLFMAKISHELRTPMHAVLGYLGLVLRDKPPDSIARRLNVAQRAGQQLVGQIDDLLDYVRIGHDQLRIDNKPFALSILIDSVSQRGCLLADESGNGFYTTQQAGLPNMLVGDSLRMEQVLMVLVANAMRYTQQGKVTLHVASSIHGSTGDTARQAVHRLHFSVTDTGRGIAPEALAGIFALFERSAATDRDGLGLGLPIAQHILSLMDSRLEVQSQLGEGSVFSFACALPAAEAAEPLPAADTPDDAPSHHDIVGYAGATLRILLLEDDTASSQYLQDVLTDLGFDVCAFASVDAAQSALRELMPPQNLSAPESGFDLYIIDQQLGDGATGWDFVRFMHSSPELPSVWRTRPILMLSASQPSAPPGWNPQHRVAHLLKPLSVAQLVQALSRHLQPQWIQIDLPAADAPDVTPQALAEHWQRLHTAATIGSVSQIHAWRVQNAAVLQAHPTAQAMINLLDFARLALYAQQQIADVQSSY